jgi:hypothetical protein
VTNALDCTLREFLDESKLSGKAVIENGPKRAKKGVHVEGVWIGCKQEEGKHLEEDGPGVVEGDVALPSEEDEMIWWSWDGKLVGFVDW